MACPATVSALGAALVLAAAGDDRVVIATEAPFPPYVMLGDNGTLEGFDHDVMTEVCARAALACDWQLAGFDELIPGVMEGRFDVAIGGIAVTTDRREWVDFTVAYHDADDMEWFLGLPGGPGPEGALTAVKAGTLHEDWLRARGHAHRPYATEADTIVAVASGAANLAFGPFDNRADLAPLIAEAGLVPLHDVHVADAGTAMVVCKGNTGLLEQLDAAILSMRADGTLATFEPRWF